MDFAHPIDEKLADFLQSQASVDCLARGGYDQLPVLVPNDDAYSGLKLSTPMSASLPVSPVCNQNSDID